MKPKDKYPKMISIIGAGPAGCYLASLLAKEHKVQIFEEHSQIGKPVHCTGIVTSYLSEIIKHELKQDDFIINRVNKVEIFSKNNSAELRLKNPNLIIDRARFDKALAENAESCGANIFLDHKFLEKQNNQILVKHKNRIKRIRTDILVGADGANSKVSRMMNSKPKFLIGIQARAKLETDPNTFQVYFGSICPGFFAWIVPENNKIVRIGLATKENPSLFFQKFLKSKKVTKIIEKQAGLIPIYNPKTITQKDNTYLVGDAATMVKATTGGGIIQGLLAAKALSQSINHDYNKTWKREIGKDLNISLKLRTILNKFSDGDYDYLIKLINNKKVKTILESYDRDFPSRFMLKLLIQEPRFLYFLKRLF